MLTSRDDLSVLRGELAEKGYIAVLGSERSIRDAETGVRIDFVLSGDFPGDGKPKAVAFPDPDSETVLVGKVRVVSLKTLIELKLASGMTGKGRLMDLADVQRLIQERRLNKDFASQLHPYVQNKVLEVWEDSHSPDVPS